MEAQLEDKARKVGKFQGLQGLGEHGKRLGVSPMVIVFEPAAHLQSMNTLCIFSRRYKSMSTILDNHILAFLKHRGIQEEIRRGKSTNRLPSLAKFPSMDAIDCGSAVPSINVPRMTQQ